MPPFLIQGNPRLRFCATSDEIMSSVEFTAARFARIDDIKLLGFGKHGNCQSQSVVTDFSTGHNPTIRLTLIYRQGSVLHAA
ncbi:hypothetical protein A6X21_21890 [Planctopirus hydrillae]|uniref:Uncharacterized protein n=1 Tax=Planctopirus hydrillae TaxID=1841610 RepID=A0A1C3EFA6_9PLAN|nr:hypothetical protein A6X21_21890 [Planctopirus hydrillae]